MYGFLFKMTNELETSGFEDLKKNIKDDIDNSISIIKLLEIHDKIALMISYMEESIKEFNNMSHDIEVKIYDKKHK